MLLIFLRFLRRRHLIKLSIHILGTLFLGILANDLFILSFLALLNGLWWHRKCFMMRICILLVRLIFKIKDLWLILLLNLLFLRNHRLLFRFTHIFTIFRDYIMIKSDGEASLNSTYYYFEKEAYNHFMMMFIRIKVYQFIVFLYNHCWMPEAKRNKLVSLTQVKPKTR